MKVLLTVIAIAAITGGAVALSHTDTPTSYGQAAKGTQTQSLHVVRNYGLSVPANPQATINGKYVQPGSTTAEPLTSSTIVTTFK